MLGLWLGGVLPTVARLAADPRISLTVALLLLAQAGRAINDSQAHDPNSGLNYWAYLHLRGRYPRLYRWVDSRVSSANKWKNGDPRQGEAFWGSARWLVACTDLWHLSYCVQDNVYDVVLTLLIAALFEVDVLSAWLVLQPAAFLFEFIYRGLRRFSPPTSDATLP